MDLVIPILESTTNDYLELRYTLRSFEQYLHHDRLVLVGAIPSWIKDGPNVLYQPYRDDPNPKYREANIFLKLNYYVQRINTENEFIYANDDYFLLGPWNPQPPYPHQGTLYECYKKRGRLDPYKVTIGNTIKLLGGAALNLDVHAPMVLYPEIFRRVFGDYTDRVKQMENPIQWPTQYGYLLKSLYGQRFAGAYEIKDRKFKLANDLINQQTIGFEDLPYFTTVDHAVIDETVHIFEDLYPNPSRYEI